MDAWSSLGGRISIVGPTCSGKSTLAATIAGVLGLPHVELDALHWRPGWVSAPDGEFIAGVTAAAGGERWVIDGNYDRVRAIVWGRAETVVWRDLPLPLILARVVRRSWRRSRSHQLLWGTNEERFWPHLKLWRRDDSLIAWAVTTHRSRRRRYRSAMSDPRWARLRFVRLRSRRAVARFVASLDGGEGEGGH